MPEIKPSTMPMWGKKSPAGLYTKRKDNIGYWSSSELEKHTSEERRLKYSDICICGHPKYMHSETGYGKYKRFGHCKTHGCRHEGIGCSKFYKKRLKL